MTPLQIILSSIGASVVCSTAVIWLLKTWIFARLTKSIQHEYDKKLENVKTACQKFLDENRISFSWWHEELAKAICDELGGTATTFIGTSGNGVESEIAFKYGVLGCNGIYNSFSLGPVVSFDTMPFGFKNHLILSSINFRQAHMEKAIEILAKSRYDEIVELVDKEEFIKDPMGMYENQIFCKGAPLKSAVVWNDKYIDFER